MSELPATLTGLQDALADRRWSVPEALEAQHRRLRRLNDTFRCIAHDRSDLECVVRPGRLAGIGLAHKDVFDLEGWQPGSGTDRGHSSPGAVPGTAMQRLASCGAAHMATLVMAEHACGATGDNANFPERCINPLNAAAVVGGSSSGSAVAVSSEMAYGSLGTDTAGSVRIPAATCGLLGLKTTHGLIPSQGVRPLAPSLDGVGLMVRSAADALPLLEAVADAHRLQVPHPEPRLHAWLPEADLHPRVAGALDRFARSWDAMPVDPASVDCRPLARLSQIVLHAEAAHTHRDALLKRTAGPLVEAVALPGLAMPAAWAIAALAERARRVRAFVHEHLTDADLLLLPALPLPVPDWDTVVVDSSRFDVSQLLAMHRYMGFVNYLGLPALVLPVAADDRGLPICAQLLARPFHEKTLLSFARRVEARDFGPDGFTRTFVANESLH